MVFIKDKDKKILSDFIHNKFFTFLQWVLMIIPPLLMMIFPDSMLVFILFLLSLFMVYKFEGHRAIKLSILAFDLLIVIPVMNERGSGFLDVLTQIAIYSILAVGLNIVVGFAGLLDLGYVGFYAAGAYVYAIFASGQANDFIPEALLKFPLPGEWFFLCIPVSMLVAAFLGVVLGLPVLRLRGDYLAIVTLGFGEIIRVVLNNLDKPINFTNGPRGISPIKAPELFGYNFNKPIHYYFIVIIFLAFAMLLARRLNNSKIGRAWTAIKEDEAAARAMGIPLVKMKLTAFGFGASFAGAMGVFFAAKQSFVSPESFGFMESIGILAIVIMGGMGNIYGVAFGAIIMIAMQLQVLKGFSTYLNDLSFRIPPDLDPARFEKLLFGIILVMMCIFRPKGIFPAVRSLNYIKRIMKIPVNKSFVGNVDGDNRRAV